MIEYSEKISIGICHSISHLPDLLTLKGVIKKMACDQEIRQKCRFVVGGYVKGDKNWEQILKMFTDSHRDMEVVTIPAKGVHDYMEIYDDISILLAPLEDNSQNWVKSSLKIAEASCKDVVVIGSRIYVEKELRGLCVADKVGDYYKWIKYFLKEGNLKEIGEKLGKQNRDDSYYEERIENLRSLVEVLWSEEYNKTDEKRNKDIKKAVMEGVV